VKIGIVAGETSGDYLGAGLAAEILKRKPGAEFYGISGPRMQALGLKSMFPMDSISIMGIDGLLTSVKKILSIRKELFEKFIAIKPDVFIGIDVPDFNLGLEEKLRRHGITTVHYVSPTVWAWRGYRIHKIRRAVDHILTLFPFEAEFYRKHLVPVTFVGHPIADEINPDADISSLRVSLGLDPGSKVLAVLPGSRIREIDRLGRLFIECANRLHGMFDGLQFIAPMANEQTQRHFGGMADRFAKAPIKIIVGGSRDALAAADVALLASGTAALEASLLRRPMVVAYKVSTLTSILVRMFAHVEHFCMPNNLLGEPIVPEFLQQRATAGNIVPALANYLNDDELRRSVGDQFNSILDSLRQGANQKAAQAVLSLVS